MYVVHEEIETRHLVPDEARSFEAGQTVYREAHGDEYRALEVEEVKYRRSVMLEGDDPFVAALMFRELRRVTNNCDITDVRVMLTFTLSGITEQEVANMDGLLELSWAALSPGRPQAECIFYKAKSS